MASFSKQNVIRKYCFIYGMLAIGILHFLVFYLYVNFESFFLPFLDNSGNWSLQEIEEEIAETKRKEEERNEREELNRAKYYWSK